MPLPRAEIFCKEITNPSCVSPHFQFRTRNAPRIAQFIKEATTHLNVAFDCTLVALALSLVVMFLIHLMQREEEDLVIDCQQYCLEHLVGRIYEPEPVNDGPALSPLGPSRERTPLGAIAGTLGERFQR